MSFINPLETTSIPTYRVMNSDGVLLEKDRKSLNVSNEEILTWYKNMLAGEIVPWCMDWTITDKNQ
jgi:2-oxoisovalerate dehydrogenase E1 component alpha subunit